MTKQRFLQVGDVVFLDHNMKVYDEKNHVVDTTFGGKFVVVETRMCGGQVGGGMNGHDDYPDGWHVKVKRLVQVDSPRVGYKYCDWNQTYSFYQSGCFTVMHPDLQPIAKMERVVDFVNYREVKHGA